MRAGGSVGKDKARQDSTGTQGKTGNTLIPRRARRAIVQPATPDRPKPQTPNRGERQLLSAVHRDGQPRRHALFEHQHERINLWVQNYVYRPPSGEIVAVFEDVTEPRRTEQKLR